MTGRILHECGEREHSRPSHTQLFTTTGRHSFFILHPSNIHRLTLLLKICLCYLFMDFFTCNTFIFMSSRKFQAGAIYFALKPGFVGGRNGKIEDVVHLCILFPDKVT